MKIYIDKDNYDYLEIKSDGSGNIDLSIRTTQSEKNMIITAKLNQHAIDKLIANLVLLKAKSTNE